MDNFQKTRRSLWSFSWNGSVNGSNPQDAQDAQDALICLSLSVMGAACHGGGLPGRDEGGGWAKIMTWCAGLALVSATLEY